MLASSSSLDILSNNTALLAPTLGNILQIRRKKARELYVSAIKTVPSSHVPRVFSLWYRGCVRDIHTVLVHEATGQTFAALSAREEYSTYVELAFRDGAHGNARTESLVTPHSQLADNGPGQQPPGSGAKVKWRL